MPSTVTSLNLVSWVIHSLSFFIRYDQVIFSFFLRANQGGGQSKK
ncbi:unnamed protein product [Spirodela intermedia]|uniref:Uncharacterized protein n=1 Tax=Spirodela intermedia TaxID=51605 RepID=A0A7I8L7R6_SPIIN|nr:unnamed protein product [Spirodela intermedia]